MPMTGQPTLAARSITFTIFSPITSPSEPPNTVKSCEKTATGAAVDRAVAGDHRVAPGTVVQHVEVARAVADEGVQLLERARVEQLLDPLAGGQLAAVVLLLLGLRVRVDCLLAQLLELGKLLLIGLGRLLAHRGRRLLAAAHWPPYQGSRPPARASTLP